MRHNIGSWVLPCRSDLINLLELFISMALNATLKHGIKYNDIDLILVEISCNLIKDIPGLIKLFLMRGSIPFNHSGQDNYIRCQIVNKF